MRILSNLPVLTRWQRVGTVSVPEPVTVVNGPVKVDLGNPLSVLPEDVQESLRAGRAVDLKDIVPVPNR